MDWMILPRDAWDEEFRPELDQGGSSKARAAMRARRLALKKECYQRNKDGGQLEQKV